MQKDYDNFEHSLKSIEYIDPTVLNAFKALIYKYFLTQYLKQHHTLRDAKKIAHKFTLTILNFKNWQMKDIHIQSLHHSQLFLTKCKNIAQIVETPL